MAELVLKVPKSEMFDPIVVAPHNELNQDLYNAVRRYVDKYMDDELSITIYTDTSAPIEEKFREIFKEHYEDEFKAVKRRLRRNYLRIVLLTALSVTILTMWMFMERKFANNVALVMLGNFGAYYVWEIGNTNFDMIQNRGDYQKLRQIMSAKIEFMKLKQ